MITDLTKDGRPYNLARVVAHVSAPAYPSEIYELAVIDVVVDNSGVWIGETQTRTFDPIGEAARRGTPGPCTPLHLAAAIWGNWTPDLLISHDAASEAVLFGPPLTLGLPWISTYKLAREVWPECQDFDLEALSAWLAYPGIGSEAPSGAAREAELVAKLLSAMYADPGIGMLGARVPDLLVQHSVQVRQLLDFCDDHILRSAIQISALPAPSLKYPPGPWDDAGEWKDVGTDDLMNWAGANDDGWTTKAAQIEIERRRRDAVAQRSCSAGILFKRREPLLRSRLALADV